MKKNRIITYSLFSILILTLLIGCSNQQDLTGIEEPSKLENEDSKAQSTASETDNSQDGIDHNKKIKLYLSADQTVSKSSGRSIEQGVHVALSEIDHSLHGQEVEVVVLDHKGSSPRAKQHLDDFLLDENALLVYTGLHSPPVLSNRDYINENDILTLDPWAAAGPITRYPSEENWIFRLSVDDTKAGRFITEFALNEGFNSPYLILEDTGWGRSNQSTMTTALLDKGYAPVGIAEFNWSLGINQAKLILREAYESNADVVFFVGNAPEAIVFAKAMIELDPEKRLPIRSHWGITGGDFPEIIHSELRSEFDLMFLQTSFSLLDTNEHPIAKSVLESAFNLYPNEVKAAEDIQAPTGFIHAYDLTKLMIKAMEQVDPNLSTVEKRNELRIALENIESPVQGLVKQYIKPFTVYTDTNVDAHEALGIKDLSMAIYGEDNQIQLIK